MQRPGFAARRERCYNGHRAFRTTVPGLEAASRYLGRLGFVPVTGGMIGEESEGVGSPPLEPGSAVAVELVRGDAQLAGIGTVTWVDEERVLAFGHPMMSMGPSAYPMARARILTVMPRLTNSFKMGVAGPQVGTVLRDEQAGIMGTLGPVPRLLPSRPSARRPSVPGGPA